MNKTVKLVEIFKSSNQYDPELQTARSQYQLRDVYVNPNHVVFFKNNDVLNTEAKQAPLVEGMLDFARFTRLTLGASGTSTTQISVVGMPYQVAQKLNGEKVL